MSQYKLTYFNARARGEFIRLIFAAAGVKFEDHRIEFQQWPALKPTMPFHQLPVLEVDGMKLAQTAAIGRYLANKFGLAGKTDKEKARADMIVDCFEDTMGHAYRDFIFAKDEDARIEHVRKFAERLPVALNALEELLKENNGGDGYFAGNQLTWADIRWFHVTVLLTTMKIDYTSYPKLYALAQRVSEQPGIKQWVANRPETTY